MGFSADAHWNDWSVVDAVAEAEAQMEDLEKETRRRLVSPRSWLWNVMRQSMASSTEPIWIRAILWSFWKNLKALTLAPELENSIFRSSSTTQGGMLERCKVAEGGKMLE